MAYDGILTICITFKITMTAMILLVLCSRLSRAVEGSEVFINSLTKGVNFVKQIAPHKCSAVKDIDFYVATRSIILNLI